ncbi:MAG TPA: hybrid sensor histidine kinase/response regulator [Anaeromyxobacter sp.]|nr:hybrid sensor histidine kinase/response regulator [Anaeromyxobacter sp.]
MSTGTLNPASASAILSAIISLLAAACVYPLARVPDWEDLRPLPWVALTAALVAACNVTATLEVPVAVYLWTGRLQVLFLSLHILAWHAYFPGWAKRPVPPIGPALWPLPAVGLLALVPGAVYGDEVTLRPLEWLGVVYRDPAVTWLGFAVWGLLGGYALWGVARVVRWGRAGAPYPLAHALCTGALLAMGVHDAVAVSSHSLPTPYLLDFAYYVPISVFGLMTLRRIAESAADYHRLRTSLETAVVDRSRALEESRAAASRGERMATLGQVSAGVASELNGPATAVAARLQGLARALASEGRPELRRSVEEASEGVQRILGLGRQLLLAGRSAGDTGPLSAIPLAEALAPGLAAARVAAEDRVALRVSVPEGLEVRAQREALAQALANLLANAVQAIPAIRPGTVAVRTEEAGDRVRILVEDDGVGMSEEELRHVFEPFHAAKPPGMGSGLGLAVARSLVEGMQGTLRFESAVGRGTRATVELGAAEAPERAGGAEAAAPPRRASLLVIDDDPQVLRSMARVLGRQHDVRVAPGVRDGLAAVAGGAFDLILCDVMMPLGGGERFWAELLLRAPALMDRVVFMTGGAVTGEANAFLKRQPRPVLIKPFDVMTVNELLAKIGPAAPSGRGPGDGPASPSTALGRMGKR